MSKAASFVFANVLLRCARGVSCVVVFCWLLSPWVLQSQHVTHILVSNLFVVDLFNSFILLTCIGMRNKSLSEASSYHTTAHPVSCLIFVYLNCVGMDGACMGFICCLVGFYWIVKWILHMRCGH